MAFVQIWERSRNACRRRHNFSNSLVEETPAEYGKNDVLIHKSMLMRRSFSVRRNPSYIRNSIRVAWIVKRNVWVKLRASAKQEMIPTSRAQLRAPRKICYSYKMSENRNRSFRRLGLLYYVSSIASVRHGLYGQARSRGCTFTFSHAHNIQTSPRTREACNYYYLYNIEEISSSKLGTRHC